MRSQTEFGNEEAEPSFLLLIVLMILVLFTATGTDGVKGMRSQGWIECAVRWCDGRRKDQEHDQEHEQEELIF